MEQKTFDVWVKKTTSGSFRICSKIIENADDDLLRIKKLKKHDKTIDGGALVRWCDVSHWLGTFDVKPSEVKSFKLTFTEN